MDRLIQKLESGYYNLDDTQAAIKQLKALKAENERLKEENKMHLNCMEVTGRIFKDRLKDVPNPVSVEEISGHISSVFIGDGDCRKLAQALHDRIYGECEECGACSFEDKPKEYCTCDIATYKPHCTYCGKQAYEANEGNYPPKTEKIEPIKDKDIHEVDFDEVIVDKLNELIHRFNELS
jgi:hypothetical protein